MKRKLALLLMVTSMLIILTVPILGHAPAPITTLSDSHGGA
jgi:hypothetical protein